MCGIAGFWRNHPLRENASETLEAMTERLHHRGPDGYGYHLDPAKGLAMGHARLSIIDLKTGDQPLFGPDRKNILTVNGEFYDYKRIRTRLRLEGAQFGTRSDSEIALALYERKGTAFMDELRGEFAFALYDGHEDRLILARDRFGVKPLYFHVNEQGLYYGSEIKSLFAHPEVPRAFEPQAVLHQLMHTMVPGTTAYQDIQAMQPGTLLIVKRKRRGFDIQEHAYWDIQFPRDEDREEKSEAAHIEAVRSSLLEAVAYRLEADVPVGCYLSGGIDSCSMLGLAASLQQAPVKAFTISFDHRDYDESHIAKEMADRVGAEQEQIRLGATELYGENYVRTMWHAERTFYNTLGVAKWCMSRRVNECGYRVVVTGEGADELFGGYPAFKRDMLRFSDDTETLRQNMESSNQLFKGAILSEGQVSHPAWDSRCGFTPSWIQPWMQSLDVVRPLLHDDLLHTLKDYDPLEAIVETLDPQALDGRHFLDKVQYTWIKTMLECQILNWGGDRVDMANSMESRPAFLDHHVAEVARNIPPNLRIRNGQEKWVLREAMKDILPEVLYKREKFAFMAPPGHTEDDKASALKKLILTYADDQEVSQAGLFDKGRLQSFLKEWEHDADAVSLVRKDALLNHVLGLQILHHQFIANSGESAF